MDTENADGKSIAVRHEFKKFGTEIDFQIVVENEAGFLRAREDMFQAEKKLDKLEKIFSRFESESELSRMNSRLGIFKNVSPEISEIALKAIEYNKSTGGYFDPRIIVILEKAGYDKNFDSMAGLETFKKEDFLSLDAELANDLVVRKDEMEMKVKMDFAGLVKGYAVDLISDFFRKQGWKNFLVDLGGDMYFSGTSTNKKTWYIDIEGIAYEKILLNLSDTGVATSGIGKRKWEIGGKRFHHLVDPKNPQQFDFDLKSVTVIDSSVEKADVLAKTLFLMGKEKGLEFARANHIPCIMLDYRGNAFIASAAKRYLSN